MRFKFIALEERIVLDGAISSLISPSADRVFDRNAFDHQLKDHSRPQTQVPDANFRSLTPLKPNTIDKEAAATNPLLRATTLTDSSDTPVTPAVPAEVQKFVKIASGLYDSTNGHTTNNTLTLLSRQFTPPTSAEYNKYFRQHPIHVKPVTTAATLDIAAPKAVIDTQNNAANDRTLTTARSLTAIKTEEAIGGELLPSSIPLTNMLNQGVTNNPNDSYSVSKSFNTHFSTSFRNNSIEKDNGLSTFGVNPKNPAIIDLMGKHHLNLHSVNDHDSHSHDLVDHSMNRSIDLLHDSDIGSNEQMVLGSSSVDESVNLSYSELVHQSINHEFYVSDHIGYENGQVVVATMLNSITQGFLGVNADGSFSFVA
ncbi:MAG: hypothetical protein H0W88_01020 [Parachlamydiaceae bacterium]|nr:hypothetical protein [Parachlamydiaceae bacterium]